MTTRTALVFNACNRIAADAVIAGEKSVKPTVSLVRKYGVEVGSQTDVQNDIHLWYLDVFKNHMDSGTIAGIPDSVAAQFKAIWTEAVSVATDSLAAERQALSEREAAAAKSVSDANAERDEAVKLKDATALKLEATEAAVIDLKAAVSELKTGIDTRDQRIQALNDQMALAIQQHSEELLRARDEASRKIEELNGLRELMMRETDAMRQSIRESTEQIAALKKQLTDAGTMEISLRERASRAETAAGELKGRADVIAARLLDLETSREQYISRVAVLNQDLEKQKALNSKLITDNTELSAKVMLLKSVIEQKDAEIYSLSSSVR